MEVAVVLDGEPGALQLQDQSLTTTLWTGSPGLICTTRQSQTQAAGRKRETQAKLKSEAQSPSGHLLPPTSCVPRDWLPTSATWLWPRRKTSRLQQPNPSTPTTAHRCPGLARSLTSGSLRKPNFTAQLRRLLPLDNLPAHSR